MTTAHRLHALIATMRNPKAIEEVLDLREEMPLELRRHLVGPLSSSHNLYVTFVMIPQGSAYGDDLEEWRNRLATVLRRTLTDWKTGVDMVHLEYGGDEQRTIIHETFDARGVSSPYMSYNDDP